jgi:hypothetical protein
MPIGKTTSPVVKNTTTNMAPGGGAPAAIPDEQPGAGIIFLNNPCKTPNVNCDQYQDKAGK